MTWKGDGGPPSFFPAAGSGKGAVTALDGKPRDVYLLRGGLRGAVEYPEGFAEQAGEGPRGADGPAGGHRAENSPGISDGAALAAALLLPETGDGRTRCIDNPGGFR